jgi:hypothetical protein
MKSIKYICIKPYNKYKIGDIIDLELAIGGNILKTIGIDGGWIWSKPFSFEAPISKKSFEESFINLAKHREEQIDSIINE